MTTHLCPRCLANEVKTEMLDKDSHLFCPKCGAVIMKDVNSKAWTEREDLYQLKV